MKVGSAGVEAESVPRMSDGAVMLRASRPGDMADLIAGRDEEFHRWMGLGSDAPAPAACVVVEGRTVGWVDFDPDRGWLEPGEVNVGYNVFAAHRGRGYASRAVQLLGHHLALRTTHRTMSLLIDPGNRRSLALAHRLGFTPTRSRPGQPSGQRYFTRPVPPTTYTDGVVTIRPPTVEDIDADLEAKDDEHIRWMWLPGQRQRWNAMTTEEQRAHALRVLHRAHVSFGTGPTWRFAADIPTARYVASVDCDLSNDHVPAGEANVSYSTHPRCREAGYASRAVRLVLRFLSDHTGARDAHLIIDPRNTGSLRVARAVGATEAGQLLNQSGDRMIRHVLPINRLG